MAKLEKYVTFVLDRKHVALDPRRNGSNRGVSIPAKDIINETDPKSGIINKRVAVYNPSNGQRSLFLDEWANYKGETDFRLIAAPKVTFYDKVMILDPTRHDLLIKYLRMMNSNGSNPERDPSSEVVFTEESDSKEAEDQFDFEELTSRAIGFIIEAREENLIQLAELLGRTTLDRNSVPLNEKELKMDLISYSKRNAQEVLDIIGDPRLETRIQINRAFELRIISYDKMTRQILWNDTKEPVISLKVRKGLLPKDVLVNYCTESGGTGKEIYNDILYKLGVESEDNYIMEENPDVIDKFTSEELVQAAKDAGILLQSGAYLFLDSKSSENQLSKGKGGVIKILENDGEHNGVNLKSYLIRKIKLAMNAKIAND